MRSENERDDEKIKSIESDVCHLSQHSQFFILIKSNLILMCSTIVSLILTLTFCLVKSKLAKPF